jgi:hypothetical protein
MAKNVNIFDLAADLLRRHPRTVSFAVVALVFAWFVWPTPYRSIGPDGRMQINRLTGATCPVGESCWLGRPESDEGRPERTIGRPSRKRQQI